MYMFYHFFRDPCKNRLLSEDDEDSWGGWGNEWENKESKDSSKKSEDSSSGYDTKKAEDDLESWLNDEDDSLIKSSNSKSKSKKTQDDGDNWGETSKKIEKVKNDKTSTKGKTSEGWEDVDWNSGFSSNDKHKQPLVGNLVDISDDSHVATNGNTGWDNEVWANEEDDEWQSLDIGSSQNKLK